jgi:hypothetical protein
MLIEGIAVAVAVAALAAVLLTRRLSHGDVHSVEGYHRSLHTLGTINAHPVHPPVSEDDAAPGERANPAYPESAVRLAGGRAVRVTDGHPDAPSPAAPASAPAAAAPAASASAPRLAASAPAASAPPASASAPRLAASAPAVADPELKFDDAVPSPPMAPLRVGGHRDKAMQSINHRPRRLAAPALAVACVIALVVVLVLTGSHTVNPRAHHGGSSGGHVTSGHTSTGSGSRPHRPTTPTTPSTLPLMVSAPQTSTTRAATYNVSDANFTLALATTSGPCWVDVTNSTTGATLFAATLAPGQQHTVDATAPVTVVVGAPTVFVASVNGSAVVLPQGFQTPFTMSFVMASPPSS